MTKTLGYVVISNKWRAGLYEGRFMRDKRARGVLWCPGRGGAATLFPSRRRAQRAVQRSVTYAGLYLGGGWEPRDYHIERVAR